MINVIFHSETGRMIGHSTVDYSSDAEYEQTEKTAVDELSAAFENADVDELAGVGDSIEEAIDDPLAYRDFLILDDNGEIAFDEEYEREEDG